MSKRQPFMGEEMTCVMCGCVHKSDPNLQSQWRLLQLDGYRFYVCPKHFPDDRTATVKKFSDAHYKVISKCIEKVRQLKVKQEGDHND